MVSVIRMEIISQWPTADHDEVLILQLTRILVPVDQHVIPSYTRNGAELVSFFNGILFLILLTFWRRIFFKF